MDGASREFEAIALDVPSGTEARDRARRRSMRNLRMGPPEIRVAGYKNSCKEFTADLYTLTVSDARILV